MVHSSDFSLVSAAKPAKAGEVLTLFANGLGPINPGVDYGQPFPSTTAPVTSPVQVSVSGAAGDVLYAGSYPGAVDAYLVNFRMPSGPTSGSGTLVLTVGFVAGSPVTIPVQ